MDRKQGRETDYGYFRELWENPKPAPSLTSGTRWDERADDWMANLQSNGPFRAKMEERVQATAAFLRGQGLLQAGSKVLDIGCGPGLFSTEFAKTAGHVTGVDISGRMCRHARSFATQRGTDNTAFTAMDFAQADIAALGWEGAFDFVMACLTPAITCIEDLRKAMSASRGHCMHVSFVHAKDSLEQAIIEGVYGSSRKGYKHWDGRVFYSVFNLLYLDGYNPVTHYFKQAEQQEVLPDIQLAQRYADMLCKSLPDTDVQADAGKILAFLEQLAGGGKLTRRTEECYGFLLWDVRDGYGRDYTAK